MYGNLIPVSVDGNVAPATFIGSNIFCPLAKKASNKHTARWEVSSLFSLLHSPARFSILPDSVGTCVNFITPQTQSPPASRPSQSCAETQESAVNRTASLRLRMSILTRAVRQSSHSVCAYKWNHLHPKYHLYCYGFSLFPPEHWQDALGVFFSLRYQNKISSKRLASEFWCQGVGASPWVIQLKAKLRGGGFHFRN